MALGFESRQLFSRACTDNLYDKLPSPKYLSPILCAWWCARLGATFVNKQRHLVLMEFTIRWKRQLINMVTQDCILFQMRVFAKKENNRVA